jgi:pimeloyl-ACP methyl ester carboxylesterase
MKTPPIILVPGFWLGAWAWDDVVAHLRSSGHDVTALTLPGLESADADRASITFDDHVQAIIDAVESKREKVVLAVHSGTGFSGYAVTDRIPEKLAHMVYVDSAPGKGALKSTLDGPDSPMSWEELTAGENFDGVSEAQKATFRERAVPEPAGVMTGSAELTNDARLDVPTTLICTGYPSADYIEYAKDPDNGWLAGLPELRNVTYVDMPTSHWPMWSKPAETAEILAEIAKAAVVETV